ncbi:MAG TPA: hypothetical protein PKC28_07270, partial [Bdellovibrionales bacterium]|nr:hypothetical protein [Bdellovibrionales bacterium]
RRWGWRSEDATPLASRNAFKGKEPIDLGSDQSAQKPAKAVLDTQPKNRAQKRKCRMGLRIRPRDELIQTKDLTPARRPERVFESRGITSEIHDFSAGLAIRVYGGRVR